MTWQCKVTPDKIVLCQAAVTLGNRYIYRFHTIDKIFVHYDFAGIAATEVVKCREKFKIKAPEMNGPPEFMRAVRAQYV